MKILLHPIIKQNQQVFNLLPIFRVINLIYTEKRKFFLINVYVLLSLGVLKSTKMAAMCPVTIKWFMMAYWRGKCFSHYWPFVKGIHRSPVDSPHKGPIMRGFGASFVVSVNMSVSKEFCCRFKTHWHLCDVIVMQRNNISQCVFCLLTHNFKIRGLGY